MSLKYRSFILQLMVGIAYSSWAEAAPVHFTGYWKSYAIGVSDRQNQTDFLLQNAFRLGFDMKPNESTWIQLHYELFPQYRSSAASFFTNSGSSAYRLFQLKNPMLPTSSTPDRKWELLHNLDRLLFRYEVEKSTWTVGRQAISFGAARFISPLDTLVPFGLLSLNREYRPGVDAIRWQQALSDFSEIDAGLVLGEDLQTKASAAYLQTRFPLLDNDIRLLGLFFREAYLAGLSFERSIGGWATWVEGAFVWPRYERDYFRLSVGAERSLSEDFILNFEYHFNGAGTTSRDGYFAQLLDDSVVQKGVLYLGRHYLSVGMNWTINPLWTLGTSLITNLLDPSDLFYVSLEYNIEENLYWDFGGYAPTGQSTEFSLYPALIYTALRLYL